MTITSKNTFQSQVQCSLRNTHEVESTEHIILHRPNLEDLREQMFCEIRNLAKGIGSYILENGDSLVDTLPGKPAATDVLAKYGTKI